MHEAHADIVQTEGGTSFLPEYLSSYAILAADLRGKVENARGVTPEKLLASYALADSCRPTFDRLFGRGLDVILTPSAPGEAPEGLHTTGQRDLPVDVDVAACSLRGDPGRTRSEGTAGRHPARWPAG